MDRIRSWMHLLSWREIRGGGSFVSQQVGIPRLSSSSEGQRHSGTDLACTYRRWPLKFRAPQASIGSLPAGLFMIQSSIIDRVAPVARVSHFGRVSNWLIFALWISGIALTRHLVTSRNQNCRAEIPTEFIQFGSPSNSRTLNINSNIWTHSRRVTHTDCSVHMQPRAADRAGREAEGRAAAPASPIAVRTSSSGWAWRAGGSTKTDSESESDSDSDSASLVGFRLRFLWAAKEREADDSPTGNTNYYVWMNEWMMDLKRWQLNWCCGWIWYNLLIRLARWIVEREFIASPNGDLLTWSGWGEREEKIHLKWSSRQSTSLMLPSLTTRM